MSIYTQYESKCISAEQAVASIQSGDWVDYGNFLCAPMTLDIALAKRAGTITDVKVRAVGFPGLAAVAMADPEGQSFTYNNWHFTAGDRILHDKGACHYIPLLYHEGPKYYEKRNLPSDVFMVQTTPMDKSGFFNFGIANSVQYAQAKNAKKIIVEINENLPYCMGGYNEAIHISEVDMVVKAENRPLVQLGEPATSEIDMKIAGLVMNELCDGACLQLGIGAMPNTIGRLIAESELKDLGIHTEMLVDAFVDMYYAGRITNRRKAINPGKMTYTFALGSQKLYDFIDWNPMCSSFPVDFVNSPEHIAANDNFMSINNAMEIDLFGQVSSESSGYRQVSGTGGQFDFHYGAFHSKGGKAFICLSSTTKNKAGETISRIRPTLDPGTIVTLPRTAVDYVVTEHGIVSLKGKSTWERAEALIGLAAPEFRDELIAEAEKMRIWRPESRQDQNRQQPVLAQAG